MLRGSNMAHTLRSACIPTELASKEPSAQILMGIASPLHSDWYCFAADVQHPAVLYREPLGGSPHAYIPRTPFNTQPVYHFHDTFNVGPLPPLCCRSWRMAFSRERVSTATFAVRARASAALAASAQRFLPAFPDVRHVVLRCGGGVGEGWGKGEGWAC